MADAVQRGRPGWDPDLHPAQVAAYRRMTPEQKLAIAHGLYRQAFELKKAGLRMHHPEWTEAMVEAEARRIFAHAQS